MDEVGGHHPPGEGVSAHTQIPRGRIFPSTAVRSPGDSPSLSFPISTHHSDEDDEEDDLHTPVKIRPEDEAPDSPLGPPPTPFSPGGRQSVFYSKLTTHEHQRLREFRALLNKSAREDPALLSTPALKRFANDATLCRYLRARDWNLKRAMKMLKCVPDAHGPIHPPTPPNPNPKKTKLIHWHHPLTNSFIIIP